MSDPGASKSASSPSRKKRGGTKLIVLLGLVLAVLLGVQTGFVGYGLAHLKALTFPGDESLLEYVPASAGGVVVIDPHQLELGALGGEGSAPRAYLERTREDIKKASGVDLAFDVDKLVLSPVLVVARGRFSHQRLADRLAEHGYAEAEHKGVKFLARSGEDAVAVVDGSILLYGDEAGIRAGLDAEAGDSSLADRDEVTDRLDAAGWNHPVLATVQLADAKPSLRSILTGFTGPRAVSVAVATMGGLAAKVSIEAASPSAAEELRKLLEEKRADAEALKALAGPEIGVVLADIAKRGTITAEPNAPHLAIHVDVTPEELDKLVKATEKATSSFGEVYKNVRLFQLLVPKF